MKTRTLFLLGCLVLSGAHRLSAETQSAPAKATSAPLVEESLLLGNDPLRGWGYLIEKLRADGVPEIELRDIYLHPAMPPLTRVPFALEPKETAHMYRLVLDRSNVREAGEFLRRHQRAFLGVERELKVSRHVIASILSIETRFGANVGRHLVINRLSRLAAIDAPDNVLWNFREHQKKDPTVTYEQVATRAAYLTETFYPEVQALFEMSRRYRYSLLELRGSIAGAFGLPQFLPRSFMRFGRDGDGDSVVSLFSEVDAIWSVGSFLANAGWSDEASLTTKRAALWRYNRSDPYIDAVLALAGELARVSP